MVDRVSTEKHGRIKWADASPVPRQYCTRDGVMLGPEALDAFIKMADVAKLARFDLKITSGWRPHRWKSFEHYAATLIDKYRHRLPEGASDAQIIRYGRRYLAFDSPHETGRAIDLKCHGLAPISATASAQKELPVFLWLRTNAATFGFHPYAPEPWHWEFP